ncbi:MAG: type II toxin-antitoxin system VapC family toxin [Bryobacteraceae bacterium]|nr:type II toxin-antitoxin system VapC family toxin [Bryobacteraceae bacterium]
MKLLLDTHVLLWWLDDSPRLPPQMRELISDPERTVFVSTATAWEIRMKQKIGKLDLPAQFDAALDSSAFHWLPVSRAHADYTAQLPFHHRDPFDRMLIAQAHCEGFTLLTADARLAAYGKNILWISSP